MGCTLIRFEVFKKVLLLFLGFAAELWDNDCFGLCALRGFGIPSQLQRMQPDGVTWKLSAMASYHPLSSAFNPSLSLSKPSAS